MQKDHLQPGPPAVYRASAFTPETASRVNTGKLHISAESVRFESPGATGVLPFQGMQMRRGGHNDEQIFFEHAAFPGWSIYSSDPALASDPVLRAHPEFSRQVKAVERSRKRMPLPVVALLVIVGFFLLAVLGLWSQKDRIAEAVADRVPRNWEESLGNMIFENIQANATILTNSPWEERVEAITSRLAPVVEGSGYNFRFHIMDHTNVNAFAIPGGHVVILTGLLEAADSPEEVAGVLAHELAHVTRRHSLRNMVKSAGLLVMVQAMFGDASGIAAVAVEGSRYLLQQKFSRDFEREADDTGWLYLVQAKIDPRGMIQFFERMREMAAASGMSAMENSLALVNTHPSSQERIERLERKWAEAEMKTGFVDLGRWNELNESNEP